MARPTRKEQIPNLPEAIKETAWKLIAKYGAQALSLRAIAREIKITAPAIYNYFPSRDDLVTAMAVDALLSLEDSQKKSIELIPVDKLEKRLTILGLTYRDWALQHEQHYHLIFSTTIPGYEVPDKSAIHAAAWAMLPLIETVQALYAQGKLRVERIPKLTPGLKDMLKRWSELIGESGREAHIEALYLAFVIWSRVHGLVTLELCHQTPPFVTDPGEIYRREIESIKFQYL
jgi:AcrR family transcriptional regulator